VSIVDTLARRVVWTTRINAVASVAIGLMMVFWPGQTLLVAAVLLGLWLLAQGATRLVEAFSRAGSPASRGLRGAAGLLLVAAGAVVIRHPGSSLTVVVVLAAVALLVGGAVELVTALAERRPRRLIRAVLGLVGVLAGVVILAWPKPSLHTFAALAGVSLVVLGAVQYLAVRRTTASLKALGTPPF
jgi:uncharacterized membrane protein HdeD (DUF308 family)